MPALTVPSRTRTAIDVERHRIRLAECGPGIRAVLRDLVLLRAMLVRVAPTLPLRDVMAATREELAGELFALLRAAYGHLALIATVDPPGAWRIWDTVIGPVAWWNAAGLTEFMAYWRNRSAPAHWLTHEDFLVLRAAKVPPAFDPALLLNVGGDDDDV